MAIWLNKNWWKQMVKSVRNVKSSTPQYNGTVVFDLKNGTTFYQIHHTFIYSHIFPIYDDPDNLDDIENNQYIMGQNEFNNFVNNNNLFNQNDINITFDQTNVYINDIQVDGFINNSLSSPVFQKLLSNNIYQESSYLLTYSKKDLINKVKDLNGKINDTIVNLVFKNWDFFIDNNYIDSGDSVILPTTQVVNWNLMYKQMRYLTTGHSNNYDIYYNDDFKTLYLIGDKGYIQIFIGQDPDDIH